MFLGSWTGPRGCSAVHTVLLIVSNIGEWPVDQDLRKVGAAQAGSAGCRDREVAETAAGIVGEMIPGTRLAVRKVARRFLGEEVVRVPVQDHPPSRPGEPESVLGNSSWWRRGDRSRRRTRRTPGISCTRVPTRVAAGSDGCPRSRTIEVRDPCLAISGTPPKQAGMHSRRSFQWNFTKVPTPLRSPAGRCGRRTPPSCMACGESPVRHQPHHGVQVSGCSDTKSIGVSCADAACGISLCGSGLTTCEVGELDAVLDEEHREVVSTRS